MSEKLVDITGGYGVVYKKVMKNNNLSIEAKAIYSYLCTYAGNKVIAFPSVNLICHELNISEKRFYKHRKELIDNKVISTHRERTDKGFSNTIYTLNHYFVHGQNVHVRNVHRQNVHGQNDGTKNNNNKNNNNKNNNSRRIGDDYNKKFSKIVSLYQSEIQINMNQTTMTKLQDDFDTYGYDLLKYAIEKSALKNAYNYSLIDYLLKDWKKHNLNNIESVKQYEDKHFFNKQNKIISQNDDDLLRETENKLNSVGYNNLSEKEKEIINKNY